MQRHTHSQTQEFHKNKKPKAINICKEHVGKNKKNKNK